MMKLGVPVLDDVSIGFVYLFKLVFRTNLTHFAQWLVT